MLRGSRFIGWLLMACILVMMMPEFVTAQDTPAEPREPVFTIDALGGRIREAPAIDADLIVTANGGEVSILATTEDGNFYLVEFDEQLGWIHRLFGKTAEDAVINVPALADIPVSELPIYTFTQDTDLFLLPDEASDVVTAAADDLAVVLAINEDASFYMLGYQGNAAWVKVDDIELDAEIVDALVEFQPSLEIVKSKESDESTASVEACTINTDQPRTVYVRVGYGENRTSVAMLADGVDFEVVGQNTDDADAVWYALNKEEAAPGKSISGDVAWVAAAQITEFGDCEAVPVIDATGIIPIVSQPPAADTADDTSTEPVADTAISSTTTVSVPGNVEWFNTGITVPDGATVTFSASGAVGTSEDGSYGPGGQEFICPYDAENPICALNNVVYGALLGRVGSTSPFYIGVSGSRTVTSGGILYLTANDNSGFYNDNHGSFTVTVTIES